MTRDWTEEQARAWLRASLPSGWVVAFVEGNQADVLPAQVSVESGPFSAWYAAPTLRSACRALIRAAKRAGIAVNQVQEPGGKS